MLDSNLDKAGGVIKTGDTRTLEMKLLMMDLGLIDIWRLKNPLVRRYTFRQRRPLIQSRLDYILITNSLNDMVDKPQILTSFCSDHSGIALQFSPLPKQSKGNGFWKFNSSLINDTDYVGQLNELLQEWITEYDGIEDKRLTWELLKYEIRKFTCRYCADKKKAERLEEHLLQTRLDELEVDLGTVPGNEFSEEYYTCKAKILELEELKAKGAIIRSKVKWLEEGEKSTQYFFSLEKYNYSEKNIRKLNLDCGETVTSDADILYEATKFYGKLYESKITEEDEDNMGILFDDKNNIPELTKQERDMCDEHITEQECFESLKTFKNNKNPGNDGLTKELYVTFWKSISKPLLNSYLYSQEVGSLSNSQRQAIITLLEKHGQDRCYLANWRPISLLNVDYKILTKVLANRVKRVLPSIISNCQNGYVRNRSIHDSIRLVQDIIQYTEITQSPGVLLSVDFRKAFDSIEWNFIIKVLRKYNFGPGLINWINIVYSNISSCIYNNGKTSRYISLHRGVRQGDPLSPYLFIIAADILARTITKDHHIKGFKINSTEIKMTQYADDLTLLLSDMNSGNQSFIHFENIRRMFRS